MASKKPRYEGVAAYTKELILANTQRPLAVGSFAVNYSLAVTAYPIEDLLRGDPDMPFVEISIVNGRLTYIADYGHPSQYKNEPSDTSAGEF